MYLIDTKKLKRNGLLGAKMSKANITTFIKKVCKCKNIVAMCKAGEKKCCSFIYKLRILLTAVVRMEDF